MTALTLALACAATPPGTLADRVVAVVDKQVITMSELLTEARVVLVYKEGEQVAAADIDEELLRGLLDYVVNQVLVAAQARRLGAGEVSEADIDKEVQRFAHRFRSLDAYRAFLRRFDIGDEALRNIAQRNLRNDRFVAERMRLSLVADAGLDPSSPRYQQALKRWLDELRDAVELRLLGPTGELEVQGRGR